MARGALAGLLVALTLAVTSFAYSAAVARKLVFEPDTVSDAVTNLLDSESVRDAFAEEIVDAFETDVLVMPHEQATETFGFDTRAAARTVADTTVASPEFREAVRASLVELHAHIFEDRNGPIVIDATAVTEVARAAAAEQEPALAQLFPEANQLRVTIPVDSTPRLSWVRSAVDTGVNWAFLAAVALAATAFVIHGKRHRVLLSLGLGLIAIAAGHLIFAWVLPELVDARYTEVDDIPVARPLASAIGDHIQRPATLLALMGVVLVVASIVWRTMAPRRGSYGGGRDERYDSGPTETWAPPADKWGRPY